MKSNVVKRFGKGALTAVLVASLSVMMTPVMAFADPNPDDFALPIVGDGGHAMEKRTGDIDTEKNGALVEAKNNGIALGDLEGSVSASGTGVEVVAHDTSAASFEASGDVTSTGSQSYGAIVETQDGTQKALAQAEVGNVKAPSGFKVEADGGIATIVTEDVTATDADDENVESNLIRASGGGDLTLGTANAELGGVSSKSNGLNIRLDPLGAANVNTGKIEADKDGINAENTFGVAILVASAVSSKNCGIYSQTHGAEDRKSVV